MKKLFNTLLILFAVLSLNAQVKDNDNEVTPPFGLVDNDGNVVGAIGGNVDVSALGGATYTIPIQLPEGVGGMQPNLSIVYNSQSGNGLLGWGWNLGGLSAITRVGQTQYHDGNVTGVSFTYQDRFALDGQRLRPLDGATNGLDGTEYRTEVDGMMKIKSFNRRDSESGGDISPACFRVWTPDGRVLEYGSSTSNEAKVFYRDEDGTQHTAIWLLRRVEDEYGNYMEYHYRIGGHDYRLEDIQFSGYNDGRGTDYGIDFHYYEGEEKRKDIETVFIGDFTLHSSWLLKDISVYHFSQDLYKYEFGYYENSGQYDIRNYYNRLKSIRFHDVNKLSVASTMIEWGEYPTVTNPNYGSYNDLYITKHDFTGDDVLNLDGTVKFAGDFNGDGLQDVIIAGKNVKSADDGLDEEKGVNTAYAYLNTGNTKNDSNSGEIDFDEIGNFVCTYEIRWIQPCDIDGDGCDEVLLYGDFATSIKRVAVWFRVYKLVESSIGDRNLANVAGSDSLASSDLLSFSQHRNSGYSLELIDDEWHLFANDYDDLGFAITEEKNYSFIVGDFMGRGQQDFIFAYPYKPFKYFSYDKDCGRFTMSEAIADWNAINYIPGDFNGDGKTEVWFDSGFDDEPGLIASVYIDSNGNYTWAPVCRNFSDRWQRHFVGDFNGDGHADFLKYDIGRKEWKVILFKGNTYSYPIYDVTGIMTATECFGNVDPGDYSYSIEGRGNLKRYLEVTDMDGDGKSDIVMRNDEKNMVILYGPVTEHGFERKEIFDGHGIGFDRGDACGLCVGNFFGQENAAILGSISLYSMPQHSTYYNVKNITDGMGNRVAIDYGYLVNNPMTDENIYTINEIGVNQGPFDIYNVPIPIRAVKAISATNVKVSESTMPISKTDYTYTNAMVHKKGRGFLGFEGITSESSLVEKVTKDIAEATRKIGKTVQAFSFKPMGEHPMVVLDTNSVFRYKTNDECVLVATTRYEYQKFICKLDMGLSNDPNSKKLLTFMPMVKRTETSNFELLGERNGLLRRSITENQYNRIESGDEAYYVNTVQMTNSKQGTDGTDVHSVEQCEYQSETATQYEEDVTSQNQWIINRPHTVSTTMKRKTPGFQDSKSLTVYKYNRVFQRLPETVTTYPSGEQSTTDRLATKVTYTYDNGHVETETLSAPNDPGDPNLAPRTTNYGYDPRFRFVTNTTNPLGYVSESAYDEVYGELKTTTDCNGYGTYSEDVEHLGVTTRTYDLDTQGNRIKGTESVTALRWLGEVMKQKFASDLPDALYYSWTKSTGSAPSSTIYDAAGRVLRSVSYGLTMQDVVFKDTKYDRWGRVCQESEPYFSGNAHDKWTNFTYDNFDRVVRTDYPKFNLMEDEVNVTYYPYTSVTYNDLTTTTHTGASLTYGASDGESHTTSTTLNFMGWTDRNVEELEESENTTSYAYNADGSLAWTEVNDRGFTRVSMTYDNAGNRITLRDPDYGIVSEEYDAFGQLKSSTTPKRDITTYEYDLLGRQTKRTETDKSVTPNVVEVTDWNYSAEVGKKGLLDNISFADRQTIAYTYDGDNYNRLSEVSETRSNETYETSYDYENTAFPLRVTTVHYPTGYSVTKEYDENTGRLYQIKHDETVLWETKKVNEYGQITDFTLGNGVTSTYTYDDRHLLSNQSAVKNGRKIQDFSYTYDIFANLAARTENKYAMPITESFTYDKLNRLTAVTLNGEATGATDYDAYGRILSKTEGGRTVFSDAVYYDVNKPHAVRDILGTGEVPIEPHTIDYTMFDKVKEIRQGNLKYVFDYGYDHQRTKMTHTYNGILQYQKTYVGNCEYYNMGGRRNVTYLSGPMGVFAYAESDGNGFALKYVHKDHLGSWTTITGEDGEIYAEQSFDAWGNPRNPETWTQYAIPEPRLDRGFTGHEHLIKIDGYMRYFGLINMNGRMYDPVMSSFLSVDNYVQSPENSQNFNRYAYCLNNPLKYTDPSGEMFVLDDMVIGMFVGAALGVAMNGVNNYLNGQGFFNNFSQAASIGALSGLAGGLFSGVANCCLTVGGFYAGAISGAAGGFAGGFTGGTCNALCAGATDKNALLAGLLGGGIGALTGGAIGGISRGISARNRGFDFWDGHGEPVCFHVEDMPEAYEKSKNMKFDPTRWGENASRKYTKRLHDGSGRSVDRFGFNFRDIDVISLSAYPDANNSLKNVYVGEDGYIVNQGKRAYGITVPIELGGRGYGSKIYISPAVIDYLDDVNLNDFFGAVLGHEYTHAYNLYAIPKINPDITPATILDQHGPSEGTALNFTRQYLYSHGWSSATINGNYVFPASIPAITPEYAVPQKYWFSISNY